MSNVAGKAYAMNVLTPVPPTRTWLQRLIFMVARAVPSTLAGLLGLSLIHFARWVIIKREQWPQGDRGKPQLKNDYVLFCSNFNGTWDQYIDAFSDGIPRGLDLFWYASFKYPHSIPVTAFKDYIVHNQFDTGYYYNATPGSAQRDIKAALRVLAQLQALEREYPKLTAATFPVEYNKALARVQNSLGSPGYAPIASLDSARAEENRLAFLAPPSRNPAPVAVAPDNNIPTKPTTSFDGGHCFLTVLLPIKTCAVVDAAGVRRSHAHLLREALARLPTAHQSAPTQKAPFNSPFAESLRTHFARMAVIDDAIFNGPVPADAISKALKGAISSVPDGATMQSFDQLPCPYLFFSVDCDAKDEEELWGYLCDLWQRIGAELEPVLRNCFGFTERVTGAAGFAAYIRDHRLETTMPFNDYWTQDLPTTPQWMVIGALILTAVIAAAGWGFGLHFILEKLGAFAGSVWSLGFALSAIALVISSLGAAAYAAYLLVIQLGRRPFPTAPNSDLKSVLKALYLQRAFIDFAIKQQKPSAPDLYLAFGQFLAQVQVKNLDAPTQSPGTIPRTAP